MNPMLPALRSVIKSETRFYDIETGFLMAALR
jgi:hypothetical protein